MTKYLIKYRYDGSFFHGYQKQKYVKTVQGELENELFKLTNEKIKVTGAGRLDKGVHAVNHYSHFVTSKKILKKDFNIPNIKIKKLKKVHSQFHSRFNVSNKTYVYVIKKSFKGDVNKVMLYKKKLDLNSMKKATQLLIGTNNYKNFVSGKRHNYEGYIKSIKIINSFKYIFIIVKGKNFYKHQIRNIVGALMDVGKGNASILDIKKMLNYPNINKKLSTAISNGLYLFNIRY